MSEHQPLTARQLVATLVAHRGYQKLYPENTALSVTQAIKAGALFVEIDIQLSKDHQPLVYHDISLERVSACPGSVADLTLRELEQLPAYEPQRLGTQFIEETISSLETVVEIIHQHPAVTLFVELKEESIEHFDAATMLTKVCEILQPISERAVLISFDYDIIEDARHQAWPQVGEYTFVNQEIIPADRYLDKLSTKLVAYEVGTVELARKLRAQKVEMLETFDIAGLLANS
jgi:glycerophosphoryl diester phosphodiesterase